MELKDLEKYISFIRRSGDQDAVRLMTLLQKLRRYGRLDKTAIAMAMKVAQEHPDDTMEEGIRAMEEVYGKILPDPPVSE